jgi:hypothetical protein
VVREGVGAGERNDPSLVCTYELKKKKKKKPSAIYHDKERDLEDMQTNGME